MRYWNEFWPLVLSIGFLAGVAGNLVASLLWALPVFWRLHAKLDRHHAERLEAAGKGTQAPGDQENGGA